MPALHRNTIGFIGMSNREDYLATKVVNDKFIALDIENTIYCWSVVTGKLLSNYPLSDDKDYSGFEIFHS